LSPSLRDPSLQFLKRAVMLPPLPAGSTLKFTAAGSTAEKRFPSLLQNLEGEMSRLLEWASTGDEKHRGPKDPTHSTRSPPLPDVHQRRVRLPHEASMGTGRLGSQREASYLSVGALAAHAAHAPVTGIPDAFRTMIESPSPTREPLFYSLFGEDENAATRRQFEAVLFPSKVPAGRHDVLLLHAWVNDMIARLKHTQNGKQQQPHRAEDAIEEEAMLKDAQLLFSVAFHEIIRQVSVHCLERGYLMGKIWWSEMELFQRLLHLHRRTQAAREQERSQWIGEREGIYARIAELEREASKLRAARERRVE